eukprot:14736-Heterococcus_DN1.PRE.2
MASAYRHAYSDTVEQLRTAFSIRLTGVAMHMQVADQAVLCSAASASRPTLMCSDMDGTGVLQYNATCTWPSVLYYEALTVAAALCFLLQRCLAVASVHQLPVTRSLFIAQRGDDYASGAQDGHEVFLCVSAAQQQNCWLAPCFALKGLQGDCKSQGREILRNAACCAAGVAIYQ